MGAPPAPLAQRLVVTLPLLLLTRAHAQSERFAARCRAECPPHQVLIAPLTEIAPVSFDPRSFDDADALVLTSPNAVAAIKATAPQVPVWCVGPGTAAAARTAGFVVRESGGDAAHLLADLRRAGPGARLVHVHGRHLARDLVAELAPEGFEITGVMVYEARPVPWPEKVLPALKAAPWSVAPLFSPRASETFAARLHTPPKGLRIVAISENCAARLPPLLRARCTIAEAPDAAAMLRAVVEGLSQPRTSSLETNRRSD